MGHGLGSYMRPPSHLPTPNLLRMATPESKPSTCIKMSAT